jgi:hypothetical protein
MSAGYKTHAASPEQPSETHYKVTTMSYDKNADSFWPWRHSPPARVKVGPVLPHLGLLFRLRLLLDLDLENNDCVTRHFLILHLLYKLLQSQWMFEDVETQGKLRKLCERLVLLGRSQCCRCYGSLLRASLTPDLRHRTQPVSNARKRVEEKGLSKLFIDFHRSWKNGTILCMLRFIVTYVGRTFLIPYPL